MKTTLAILFAAGTLASFAAYSHHGDSHHVQAARADVAGPEVGARIYARSCSVCHGEQGNAASWAKNSLNPPPLDFTSAALGQLTRARMVGAVTHGVAGTAMMPFTTQLSDSEILAVVDYIRAAFMGLEPNQATAAGQDADMRKGQGEADGHAHLNGGTADMAAVFPGTLVGRLERGKAAYEGNCATCHGAQGDGQGPRAYFLSRTPRDFTSDRSRSELNRPHLFEAIAKGVRQTEMAAWSKVLSAQEIADVAEYVFVTFIDDGAAQFKPMPAQSEPPESKKN